MGVYYSFRPLKSRALVFVFCLVVIILVHFFHPFDRQSSVLSSSESTWLQRHMNGGSKSPTFKRSSFDWSKVDFHYPAGKLRSLPNGKLTPLPRVQHDFGVEPAATARVREARRDAVRTLFQRDWSAYKARAWGRDALLPLSGGATDQFCGWAATLVDALDTLWIMGLRDEFDDAVAVAAAVDFGASTSPRVNTFETTIRYLGGLLAAYDLSGRKALLRKAVELGDLLYAGFNTPNRMPVDFIDFDTAKAGGGLVVEASVVSASPGTLSLELTRLSQVTGAPKYYDAADRVMQLFRDGQNKTLIPGMWPIQVSMRQQDVISGTRFTLAGCADSLYEYLPKMQALLGHGRDPMYGDMASRFMDAASSHLLFQPMLPDNALPATDGTAGPGVLVAGSVDILSDGRAQLEPVTEHLACFAGGAFALGGRLAGREDHVATGARLARGCAWAYRAMPSGLGPERFAVAPCPAPAPSLPSAGGAVQQLAQQPPPQQQQQQQHCVWDDAVFRREAQRRPDHVADRQPPLPRGFTSVGDARYILRPEAIESVFVLWRATGDPEWQDAAWDMFKAVRDSTKGPLGASAAVRDVTAAPGEIELEDYMESFWFAETLKYFYLVFSPPDLISLDGWILNTEAHPFRRPK